MDTFWISAIIKSAKTLGLEHSDPAVSEAERTMEEALMAGFKSEDAFEFARAVLIRAAEAKVRSVTL